MSRNVLAALSTATLLVAVIAVGYSDHPLDESAQAILSPSSEEQLFRWSSITPSEELIFHACYGDFQCARLEVPLNWNESSSSSDKLAIAITKLPAVVPVTDPRYGGVLLMNPGGPGGSGVAFALDHAKSFQHVVDGDHANLDSTASRATDAKFYDILGWDPRGVNNTTPFMACFSDPFEQAVFTAESSVLPGTPEAYFDLMWQRRLAIGESCVYNSETNVNGSKIANFASTAMVVRDIVEIVERHGEWRESQVEASDSTLAHDLRHRRGEEPLNYWGISYGTLLGSTFAAMQPHRAQRMVLDAVVDADDYYEGGWARNLVHTDEVLERFFEYCHTSGPAKCAMNINSTSPGNIKEILDKIEDDIRRNGPIAVPQHDGRGPMVITLSDLWKSIWTASYAPEHEWERFANATAALVHRNGTLHAALKRKEIGYPAQSGPCSKEIDQYNPDCNYYFRMATPAIACADGDIDTTSNLSKEEFKEYWDLLTRQSRYLGNAWATIRLDCIGWKGRAAWKFNKPIASNVTAHPILYVANTLDNVTPIRGARKMSSHFKGSGLLEIDMEGHSTTAGASLCAMQTINDFFQRGKLPEQGKVCLPYKRPFLGVDAPRVERLPDHLSSMESQLVQAIEELTKP